MENALTARQTVALTSSSSFSAGMLNAADRIHRQKTGTFHLKFIPTTFCLCYNKHIFFISLKHGFSIKQVTLKMNGICSFNIVKNR